MPWLFKATNSEFWHLAAEWEPKPAHYLSKDQNRGSPRAIQPSEVPKHAVFTSKRKQLPDVVVVEAWPLISGRLQQKIESLEPNRHQFFPVEISRANGKEILGPDGQLHRPAEQPYFLFNITDRVDAIDVDRSDIDDGWTIMSPRPPFTTPLVLTSDHKKIAFRPELLAGRHVWEGIQQQLGKCYISDELGSWIITNKVKGCDLMPTKWFGKGLAPNMYR